MTTVQVLISVSQFQSTHPLRDATRTVQTTTAEGSISIHAPLTGCDEEDEDADEWEEISIHAPLTGCDYNRYFEPELSDYFNPRTPYGMRRSRSVLLNSSVINFNPRTPYGMRQKIIS